MAELNWSDDFLTGGINHAVTKAEDGLRLAVSYALRFGGTDWRVRHPSNWVALTSSIYNNFSMALGCRPTLTGARRTALFPMHGNYYWGTGNFTADSGDRGAGISVRTDGIACSEHTSNVFIEDSVAAAISGWADVVHVSVNKAPRLFLNGAFLVQKAASSAARLRPSAALGCGDTSVVPQWGTINYNFAEDIDYLYVFNTALSDAEAAGLRTRIPKPDDPRLVLAWLFDEGQGTQLNDWSGHAQPGAIYGATWVAGRKRAGVRLVTLDLSAVGLAQYSKIIWTSTEPAGTGVTIETNLSLDGGRTWQGWQACANGGPIPGILPGTDLSNARLKVWEHLHTTNPAAEPVLHRLTISVSSPVSVGSPRRILPVRRSGRIHPVPHRGRVYPMA